MDKKIVRKKVRESVEIMLMNTFKHMQTQEYADIVCNALFDEKIDSGVHFKYIQDNKGLTSKHFDGMVDDLTNQIMQRFHEPDWF
jgi:hypothetical protein